MKKPSSQTIGIKDVAKAAGVSIATVSRTLANGKVSDDMRDKVHNAIIETGYRPNLAARRLRSQQNKTIGLIVADIRNPFFTNIARIIEKIVEKKGFRIILCNTDENGEREKQHLLQMIEERVAGVILAATPNGFHLLDNWPTSVPLVLIDRTQPELKFDQVKIDNEQASISMIKHMVHHGARKILCLYSQNSLTGIARKTGYEKAVQHFGLPVLSRAIAHDASLSYITELFNDTPNIDGIFISNGKLALRVCSALLQETNNVNPDLSIATFDDEPWAALVFGGLSVIRQPIEDIAKQAVRLLFQRMEKPDEAAEFVTINAQTIFRNSTQNLAKHHKK